MIGYAVRSGLERVSTNKRDSVVCLLRSQKPPEKYKNCFFWEGVIRLMNGPTTKPNRG